MKAIAKIISDTSPIKRVLYIAACYAVIGLGFMVPLTVAGTNILIVSAVVLSLLAGSLREKFSMGFRNKYVIVAMIFFSLFVVSLIYTKGPMHEALAVLHKYGKLIFVPLLIPLFLEKRIRESAITAFLIAMVVTLIFSYLKWFGWVNIRPGQEVDFVFKAHIDGSTFIAFAAYICVLYLFFSEKWRWVYGFLAICFIHYLFFVNTGRTGYVVFFGLVILLAWQGWRWKGLILVCLILPYFAASFYFFSPQFRGRVDHTFSGTKQFIDKKYNINNAHLKFMRNALRLIHRDPIIGGGAGSFQTLNKQIIPPGAHNPASPENEYLTVAQQLGIVGLSIFLFLLYTQWRMSFFLSEKMQSLNQAMILAFMLSALFVSALLTTSIGYFYVYFTALFLGEYGDRRIGKKKPIKTERRNWTLKWGLGHR